MVIMFGLLYVGLLAWFIPLNGLWAGDQGVKLVQITSLLRNKFSDAALPYPGAAIDPNSLFSPLPTMLTWAHNGRYYSAFSYPYAALTALPFFVLGYAGLYVIPVLATLATLLMSVALTRRLSPRWSWLAPLVLGAATPLGFYALVLWEHALAVALTTLAVLCVLWAIERERAMWALIGGVLAGTAFWMRSEALWFAPALLAGLVWAAPGRRRLYTACATGLALGLAPLLIFNVLVFGPLLGPHVALNYSTPDAATPARLLALRGEVARVMLLDIGGHFWLYAAALMLALLAMLPLPRARSGFLLALVAIALWGLLASPPLAMRTGLVSACPLALLAVLTFPRDQRQFPAVRLLSATALVYTVGVLISAPNDGGAQWGPRYLLPIVPLLAVLSLGAGMDLLGAGRGRQRQAILYALVALLAVSIWTQAQGVQLLRRSTYDTLRIVQVVNAQGHPIVITDTWYGPQILAPIYYDHNVLWINTPEQFTQLSSLLQRDRVTGFSYLTGQSWGRDQQALNRANLQCASVERLALGLTLMDCQRTQS